MAVVIKVGIGIGVLVMGFLCWALCAASSEPDDEEQRHWLSEWKDKHDDMPM